MKKIASTFFTALFAGAITLGAYKLFFEKPNYAIVTESEGRPVFNTSYTPTSPKGAGINEADFTTAAEMTVNAVVHVKNVSITRDRGSYLDFFYGHGSSARPQVGTGSGVIISQDGYIVTNNHVIENASQLQVMLNNNKVYDAEIIGTDPNSDIALIKIDADRKLPYLAFGDSDHVKVGEWVLAVGNPFSLTSTVTAGIVSAKARNLGKADQSFIQTDAAVNPGNSGGALVNTNGDLIGINTAITSQTGSYVGYSFAVPSNIAKKVVDDILEYGNVQKGILGVDIVRANTPYAIQKGINQIEGVYIAGIEEDTGAEEADLREGDIIKEIDDIKIRKYADLTGYLSSKRPEDTVQVTIERDKEIFTVPVVLKRRQVITVPNMGLEIKNLTKEDMKKFKTKKGVKVVGVPEIYRGYGLEGKVILSLDDQEINDIEEAKVLFGRISRRGRTIMTMINQKGERERLIFQ
ncbi:S1C family serine protease [Pseudozobellia thermophila]|uniref:Do/DeqQ family serine protease n=1 Tax=Pseudozobellia thermophila TaxID=192903 RepID=A0A1M6FBZ9_9FLAO|nr:trypsin-like peptidase domain-containing protein [Pseudozobellia thermophila]SHI95195.1 Do/DeqQ family serine protease [Pseudozobellia thermophila]